MPTFVGREKELAKLKRLWQEASDGRPCVVNLVADTGVGKTRLIQAFYEWLSTDVHQGDGAGGRGYWPDDLGMGRQRVVNPPLERFAPFNIDTDRIPWLWWGMYWTDAANDIRNGLSEFSPFLDVHLEALEVTRRADMTAREELIKVLADHGKDAAHLIPVVGQVISPAISLYKLGKALYESKRERNAAKLALGERQQSQLDAIADDLLLRLGEAFSADEPTPLVLFLDDVHFATDISADEPTLRFLDSLLRQAATRAWPLLVITTHWKGPWLAHAKNPLKNSRPWRGIVDTLKAEPEFQGKLAFHDVFLEKLPTADLRTVALDYLPGLAEDNLQAILDRVDNVRWLVEVLRALSARLECFIDHQRNQPLSPLGIKLMDKLLAQQGYVGVLRERLSGDDMRDVRAVLGATAWHAYGLDFLSPLARAFAPELTKQQLISSDVANPEQRVLDVLRYALDPASFIEGSASVGGVSSHIWFPERGYLEVARELFDESVAQNASTALAALILDWMRPDRDTPPRWKTLPNAREKQVFLGVAIHVLGQVGSGLTQEQTASLQTKKNTLRELVSDGLLSEEQYNTKVQAAEKAYLAESANAKLAYASTYQAVAMAELAALFLEDDRQQGWELADALAAHQAKDDARSLLEAPVQHAVAAAWTEKQSTQMPARQWLLAAIADSENAPEPSQTLEFRAKSYLRLGYLDEAEGRYLAARKAFDRSLLDIDELLSRFGETSMRLETKFSALRGSTMVYSAFGEDVLARNLVLQCRALSQRLIDAFGQTARHINVRVVSLCDVARLSLAQGDLTLARLSVQEVHSLVALAQMLFGETRDSMDLQCAALLLRADLHAAENNRDAVIGDAQECQRVINRIVAEFGRTPNSLDNLLDAVERIGLAELGSSRRKALPRFEECLQIADQILREFGETPDRLVRKAKLLARRSFVEAGMGNRAAARAGYDACLSIAERLRMKYGDMPDWLDVERLALGLRCDLHQANNDAESERRDIDAQAHNLELLIAKFGVTPIRLHTKMEVLSRLAALDMTLHNPASALRHYDEVVKISRHLIYEYGETRYRIEDMVRAQLSHADAHAAFGYRASAKHLLETCLEDLEGFLSRNGESITTLMLQYSTLAQLAEIDFADLTSSTTIDAGAEQLGLNLLSRLKQQVDIDEKLLSLVTDPSDLIDRMYKQARSLLRLGEVSRTLGRRADAQSFFSDGLRVVDKIAHRCELPESCIQLKTAFLGHLSDQY